MKTLKHITLIAFALIQSIGFSQTNDFEVISKKYNSLLKEQNRGLAILVKNNNKMETASVGNFSLTENSVFNIGSATKTFTAILVLQEVEKGNIQLTNTIGSYLTPIQNVDGNITIEALLTHESGLDEVVGENISDIFYAKSDSLYTDNLLNQITMEKTIMDMEEIISDTPLETNIIQ